MSNLKNLSMKVDEKRNQDFLYLQKFFSKKEGVKLTQTQTFEKMVFELSEMIRRDGNFDYRK